MAVALGGFCPFFEITGDFVAAGHYPAWSIDACNYEPGSEHLCLIGEETVDSWIPGGKMSCILYCVCDNCKSKEHYPRLNAWTPPVAPLMDFACFVSCA